MNAIPANSKESAAKRIAPASGIELSGDMTTRPSLESFLIGLA
jgi:hypothetical protein